MPREWMLAEAYKAAEKGDFSALHRLQGIFRRPYDEQPEHEASYYRRAPPEAAVCCALAALATVTHAPTARTQLKSVRRARETARAEVSQRGGAEKRYNARAWRRAVVLRLAAQWAGLLRTILGEDVFVGAATVLGANAGFWLTGGAHRRHDASGSFTPVPYATAFLVFVIDAAIVGCALLAARRPPGYARAFYASVVVAACGFGVLEMLPRWLRKGK